MQRELEEGRTGDRSPRPQTSSAMDMKSPSSSVTGLSTVSTNSVAGASVTSGTNSTTNASTTAIVSSVSEGQREGQILSSFFECFCT